MCFVFSLSASANHWHDSNNSDTLNGNNSETILAIQQNFSDLDSYFSNAPLATKELKLEGKLLQNLKLTAIQQYEAKSGNQVESFNISTLKFKQVGKNSFVEVEGYIELSNQNKSGISSIKANSYWAADDDVNLNDLILDALKESFYTL